MTISVARNFSTSQEFKSLASVADLVNSNAYGLTGEVYIKSYYDGWQSTLEGPKGGHFVHRTGATNAAPTVGSPVAPGTIGTGAQAGYYWSQDGFEWFITLDQQIDVTMFGALGDDGDDTNAIQKAFDYINNLPSTHRGKSLFIPRGRYPFTEQINLFGFNVTLFGEGESSILISKLESAEPALYIGDGISAIRGFVARDFRITGEWISGAGNGGGLETHLFKCNECLEGKITRVRVDYSSAVGLMNGGGENFQVYHCTIRANGTDGFLHGVADDATSPPLLRFDTNMVKDNGDSGIRLIAAAGHVIENNIFEGHDIGGDAAGVVCLTSSTRFVNNKFEGNTYNVIAGSSTGPVRVADISMERNRFSLGILDFRVYSDSFISNNTFINGASVAFGADEANKYTYFIDNFIPAASITNNALNGKLVIKNVRQGSTVELQATFTDGDVTPDVSVADVFRTNNTGATSITNFEFGYTGKIIVIFAGDANTTLIDGTFIQTSTGSDIALSNGDAIILQAASGTGGTGLPVWRDIAYWSDNANITASTGTLTVKSGNANSADMEGLYEIKPGIWVPYTTNPTP